MLANPESGRDRRLMQAERLADDSGFTLVEVLVAFAVMSALLAVLFRGVVGLRAGAIAFDDHLHQAIVTQAVLDDALSNRRLALGTYKGRRDGLPWTLAVSNLDLGTQLAPPEPTQDQSPAASGQVSPATGQAAQAPPNGGDAASSDKDVSKPRWTPQRLAVRVETGGRPLQIETVRLVKGEAPP